MESKALALGKRVKAKALNSNLHLLSVTLYFNVILSKKNLQGFEYLEGFLYLWFEGLFKRLFHLIRKILSGGIP